MAPEQAEGKNVDHRADIFSLGIVLYELATGSRPVAGDSTASMISSLLRDAPAPISELNPSMQSKSFQQEGFVDPIVYWMPSISTSGLAFYTGNRFAKWQGNVFVGGLRYGEIPGTGQLQRIVLNENFEEVRREPLLVDLRQRIRDVRQGTDELLYVLTDHASDGAVLRIEPAD